MAQRKITQQIAQPNRTAPTMSTFKYGLKPVKPRTTDLMFSRYRTGAPLPPHPATYGFADKIKDWLMLGNDKYGCCVWAEAAHEHILWNLLMGRNVEFDEATVLQAYTEATGFNPKKPATDKGSDIHEALKYRQKTGIPDVAGNRHTIGAYVWLQPGNYEQYLEAQYLFETLNVCIQVPESAQEQFGRGFTWTVVPGSPIEGGHCITGAGLAAYPQVITWGKVQLMSKRFYQKYNVATAAIISPEQLDKPNGRNAVAFDFATLQRDLNLL